MSSSSLQTILKYTAAAVLVVAVLALAAYTGQDYGGMADARISARHSWLGNIEEMSSEAEQAAATSAITARKEAGFPILSGLPSSTVQKPAQVGWLGPRKIYLVRAYVSYNYAVCFVIPLVLIRYSRTQTILHLCSLHMPQRAILLCSWSAA